MCSSSNTYIQYPSTFKYGQDTKKIKLGPKLMKHPLLLLNFNIAHLNHFIAHLDYFIAQLNISLCKSALATHFFIGD